MAKRDAGWRDSAATEVLCGVLEAQELAGTALEMGGERQVAECLEQAGAAVQRWTRLAVQGREATPCPPEGPFSDVVVRLPKGREALDMTLHLAAARLQSGGTVWLYGANDEGIKSAANHGKKLFDEVEVVDSRRHCRVLALRHCAVEPRATLDAWTETHEATLNGHPWSWRSTPGVFAHGRLDKGTQDLLRVLPRVNPGDRALDFACGVGPIAADLIRRGATVTMCDVDALSLSLATQNVPQARAILSDGLEHIEGRFNHIVSNPPYHQGKGQTFSVIDDFVAKVGRHLSRSGRLTMVCPRTLTMGEALRSKFAAVSTLYEGGNYRVWTAQGVKRR